MAFSNHVPDHTDTCTFATTMSWPAPRITRPAFRLLAKLRPSQGSTLSNAHCLHQHPIIHPIHPSLGFRHLISAVPTLSSTPQLTIRPQIRLFTSTVRNSARHLRSDKGRHRKAAASRPLVGMTDDELPRKDKKANSFLPFQTPPLLDASVATIVGMGLSESCKLRARKIKVWLI